MKSQIKDLNGSNNKLTLELQEKSKLLDEYKKQKAINSEVLEGKCKALQQILDETSQKNEDLLNKMKDLLLINENLTRDGKVTQGELRFFTEKYKDEFPKDRRIVELEGLIKNLKGQVDS